MSEKRPIIRQHECAYCRKMQSPQGIKICSGCKVMGYCSKECQKADWKHHKTICTKATTGKTAPSRPPSIKLAEKMMADDDLMSHIDGILISALDLQHHPENAEKYVVVLSCHVESTDTKLAASRIMYYVNGLEPPPLPEKIPKLFQISKHALLSGDSIPPALNEVAEKQRALSKAHGHLKPGSKEYLVRAMWVSPESEWATCYCMRLVSQEMIDEVASWKKPKDVGEGYTDQQMSTKDLIKLFDVRVFTEPDMKKKLTIMVSTDSE